MMKAEIASDTNKSRAQTATTGIGWIVGVASEMISGCRAGGSIGKGEDAARLCTSGIELLFYRKRHSAESIVHDKWWMAGWSLARPPQGDEVRSTVNKLKSAAADLAIAGAFLVQT